MGARCSVNGDKGKPGTGHDFVPCCSRVPAEGACCSRPAGEREDLRRPVFADDDGIDDEPPLPVAVDAAAVEKFRAELAKAGIDTTAFGKGNAKPLEVLWHEVQHGHCTLEPIKSSFVHSATLKRVVEQVQIAIVATLDGIDYVLVPLTHHVADGRLPTRKKLLVQKFTPGQAWKEAVHQTFERIFEMGSKEQHKQFCLGEQNYTYQEGLEVSPDYPALLTQYKLHEVVVFVENPFDPGMDRLGLPDIRSFTTTENQQGVSGTRARPQVWAWEEATGVMAAVLKEERLREREARRPRGRTLAEAVVGLKRATATKAEELVQRVPLPTPLPTKPEAGKGRKSPNAYLSSMVAGEKVDSDALGRAVRRMRDQDYSLRSFFDDCSAAFPELRLYLFLPPLPEPQEPKQVKEGQAELPGRSLDDEYQRTLGALFAFYWLMRADLDGKNGFCYGVDDLWVLRTRPTVGLPLIQKPWTKMSKGEKRLHFYEFGPWEGFQELLVDAGLLRRSAGGGFEVEEQRTRAMLALTAVHDIMKIVALLPRVAAEHAPYGPYGSEEEITDHDMALHYVLEHFPELIPSVHCLPANLQQLVLFTQSKMNFNKGNLLALAEGPPGELLGTFKRIIQQSSGGVWGTSCCTQEDVAFYFVHWLTDLAAAVPTPLAGSEKLVLQLPRDSLVTVLSTFKVLKRLADEDETTVYEAYLKMRWAEMVPRVSWLPAHGGDGPEAISRYRILCMARGAAEEMLEAFDRLPEADRRFLSEELLATGRRGQSYGSCRSEAKKPGHASGLGGSCRSEAKKPGHASGLGGLVSYTHGGSLGGGGCGEVGPAFLLYHGPSLLQRNNLEADVILQMLVSILRAGRAMWPSGPEAADETVTLRLDVLKELTLNGVRNSLRKGEVWLLVWHSSHEAFVERHQVRILNEFNRINKPYQALVLLQGEQLEPRRMMTF